MGDPTESPVLVAAYQAAKPPRPAKIQPLLRLIVFHVMTLGITPLFLPIAILRAAIPYLRPHRRMTFVSSLAVIMVRLSIRLMILTRFQPLAPREKGWREQPGFIGAMLASLNMSGPGARVAHPLLAVQAAKKVAHSQKNNQRNDRVWFDAPPLQYYRGVLSLKVDSTREGGSIVAPRRVTDSPLYEGPAMVDVSWAKSRTRGFWFLPNGSKQHPPKVSSEAQKEPVVLYFHGGAAVTFSAGDLFMGMTLASNFAKTSGLNVFSVDYNLAPYAPFPIPLVQALGGWLYLTNELGYRPEQIFIGGDSFGSHLTLQLERYLRSEVATIGTTSLKPGQPVCAGLILLSPWLTTVNEPFESRPNNLAHDIITMDYGDWGVREMQVGPAHKDRCSLDLLDPWLSPVYKPLEEFAQLPPMFVANGGVEVLVDEGKEWVRKARQAKRDVVHVTAPVQPHDFFTLPSSLPASRKIYSQIGSWARKHYEVAPYKV